MKSNYTQIFINMFVHYPKAYNANTISNNFIKYINEANVFDIYDNPECYVLIKSAPYNDEELVNVEINVDRKNDIYIDKEKVIAVIKKFIDEAFYNQLKILNVEFTLL